MKSFGVPSERILLFANFELWIVILQFHFKFFNDYTLLAIG